MGMIYEYPLSRELRKKCGNRGFGVDGPNTNVAPPLCRLMGGNSCTDPKNTITRYSFFMDKEPFFINLEGLLKKGELIVKTERKGKIKRKYVALDGRLEPRLVWGGHPLAMILDDYISHQIESCIERGFGFFYTLNFTPVDYRDILGVAEEDKEFALALGGLYNKSLDENMRFLLKKTREFSN